MDIKTQQTALSYVCMILEQERVPVNVSNMEKVLKAAGIEVNSQLPKMYERYFEENNMKKLYDEVGKTAITNVTTNQKEVKTENIEIIDSDTDIDTDDDAGLMSFNLFPDSDDEE